MTNLRDYFMTEGSHWIFVGANRIDQTVFGDPAVQGMIPLVRYLQPLTANEVIEFLTLRYRYVATRRNFTPPVAAAAVPTLYERYTGNLRSFLRLLSMAVQHYAPVAPIRSLTVSEVIRTVANEYWRALVRKIGDNDATYLRAVISLTRESRFRNADLVQATQLRVPSAKAVITRLLATGVIVEDEIRGKSVFYRLTGDAQTAFEF
jgi:hypothetical protein